MRQYLLLLVSVFMFGNAYSQLSMTNGQATGVIINTILGSGVTVSNPVFTGAANSKGKFNCSNACNLGLDSGIILSSGIAGGTAAPASNFHSDATSNVGDATLDALVAPLLTKDAAVLEFDFAIASDSMQFQYVFGSEEYNDWVNTSFNDVFGFFVNGPGITGVKNLAIIPGTVNTAVSINNVNNGGPTGGNGTGPCVNCAYFVDNVGGSSVYLDAFTTPLTAKSGVQPCETYHIKLAIADVSDQIYNSDVFIKANSFSSLGQIQLFSNGQAVNNNDTVYGCIGDSVILNLNPAQNYNWSTGASTQFITVPVTSTPTVYSGYVFNPTNFCFAFTTQITVIGVPPTALITPNGPTSLCPGGSVVLSANSGNSYQWSNGATTQTITVSTNGTFTVTVTNGTNCSAVSTPVTVTVGSANAIISGPSALCNGSAATLQANLGLSYVWSTGAVTQSISASSTGTYTVTVTQAGGCTATASVTLNINPNPVPNITGVNSICQGASTIFDAGAGYASYQWSTTATTQTISPLVAMNYTVTVTDNNGCTGTASYSLTINPNPAPVITGISTVCQGVQANLNAGGPYSVYSWTGGATTQQLNPTVSGVYTVTVTNANGCTGTASQQVTINALPSPNITGVFAVCQGAAASLDAGAGYNYQWSNGANSQVINPVSSGIFTVTVTDPNGCTATASANVTVSNNPVPNVTGVNTICQGTPTSFDAGAGFTTYLWNNGATSQTINPTTSGIYSVTVSNNAGCTGTSQLTLTVNALPVPVVNGTTAICLGTVSVFDAGAGFAVYQWSNGANTQTVNLTTGGPYTVTVTDANGCTGSASLSLTVNALPVPAISGINTVCQGSAASLDAGNGFAIYQWSSGANTQTINPSTSGIFTVTVTDANGCTGSVSQTVTVNNNPVPAVTGVNVICQGTPTSFDAGAGYALYSWNNGSNTQTINPNATGVYTVTVTDANGCTGTASLSLTVNANPVPVISGINSICQGNNTTFDAGAGFAAYQWSNSANTQQITISTQANYIVTVTDMNGCTGTTNLQLTVNALPTPSIAGNASICDGTNSVLDAGAGYATYQWSGGNNTQTLSANTTGIYTVTVIDLNGCTGTASFALTVNQNPVPIITGLSSICDGFNTPLDGGAGFVAYQWSNGNNTQTLNATVSGNYIVTVTDANGCTGSSAPFQFTVLYATATITVNGPLDFCKGGSVLLTANPGQSYLWSNGETSQSVTSTQTSIYTVTVLNNNGCTATTTPVQVTMHDYPVVKFSYDSSEICEALRITFIDQSTYDQGSSFLWNFGDGKTSNIKDPVHDYKAVGFYWATLTITSPWGCTSKDSMQLYVDFPPAAIPNFEMAPDLQNVFSSTINFTDLSQNAYKWYWDFGDGTSSSDQNPTHQYDWANHFTVALHVWNKSNCEEVITKEVTIAPFWIPNAFTPNGDGKNEVFFDGSYTLDVKSYDFMVLNRWGQIIYKSDSYYKPWDGNESNGNPAQQGTYVYVITVVTNSGREYTFRGKFDLIR